jgi:VWFA-related protein
MRTVPFLAAAFLAFTSAAQTPTAPAPLAVGVDVKVINVDVAVTDAQGAPVENLAKDDFEILEDGRAQAVTNFYVTRKTARDDTSSAAKPRTAQRKVIVVIDNNYIDARERSLALDTLQRFIDERFDDESQWSLGTIGQRFEVIQPLTSDKSAIMAAVGKARRTGTVSLRTDELDREILGDPFRRAAKGAGYDYEETVRFQGRERTSRNARALANTAQGLTDAAHAYSGLDGKKVIILLTGGIEMNTSFAAYDTNSDREMQDRKLALAKLLEQIVREANGGNLSIYVVNVKPRDMAAPQHDVVNQAWGGRVGSSSTGATDTSDVDSAAFTIAISTGGQYFTSAVVRQSLESVDMVTRTYYSLGYSPSHREDGKYHTITVNVKKPNLRASHRRGYLDVSPDQQLDQYLRLRISVLQPSSTVPVKLDAESSSAAEGKPVVQLVATMPWQNVTLLRDGGQYKGRVHVYLAIFDKSGANVGYHHRVQDIALTPPQYEQALKDLFRYKMAIRLDKGEFTVGVTMRDDLSREIGTSVQKLRL